MKWKKKTQHLSGCCAVHVLSLTPTHPVLSPVVNVPPPSLRSPAPDSHISVAKRLQSEIPNSHILDQYANPSNPLAHFDGTAHEILEQTGGSVAMLVAGAGTGGTISGIAAKLKQVCPDVEIVGVDPVGSILAIPDRLNDEHRLESYLVEGIGYDFIPDVLDRGLVDTWMKSNDRDSLITMRKMVRNEGKRDVKWGGGAS